MIAPFQDYTVYLNSFRQVEGRSKVLPDSFVLRNNQVKIISQRLVLAQQALFLSVPPLKLQISSFTTQKLNWQIAQHLLVWPWYAMYISGLVSNKCLCFQSFLMVIAEGYFAILRAGLTTLVIDRLSHTQNTLACQK